MKQGWEIKKLVDVCEGLFAGGDVPKGNSSKFKTEDFHIPIFSNGEKNKGLYGFTNVARVTKPSITISARGTIGYSEVREEPFYPAIRLIVVIPNSNILDLFFLKYVVSGIDFKHSGSSIPQLTVPMIKDYPILLPPLSEQQRIVAILDEVFEGIAKAKVNAEQNLKNAKELFESYLQGVFENKGEGWEERSLGDVVDIKNGRNQKTVLSDTGIFKILGSAGNVMGYATDFICEAGTTIIGRKGNISKPIFIEERFWNVDTAFGFFPIEENELDKRFVYYMCLGIDFKSMNRGTTIPSLVKSELQKIQISFPLALTDQQFIVHKLDALSAQTRGLEAIYQQKLNDLEELKKSVLQKAFAGELKTK